MGTAAVSCDASSAATAAEDVDAFTDVVAQALRDPAKRKALAAADPRDAQGWSVDVLMHKTEALYARLAAIRPASVPRLPMTKAA